MTHNLENFDTDAGVSINEGLRSYMMSIYNYMFGGLIVTALTAFIASRPSVLPLFFNITENNIGFSLLGWITLLAPFGLIFMFPSALREKNVGKAQFLFWTFSALIGVSCNTLVLSFSDAQITNAFVICGAMFAGMSLYGYTTKKDLSGVGSFMTMGLWGVILACLVNLFLKSGTMNLVISLITVVIFVGLTAYDTQKMRLLYREEDSKGNQVIAIFGALELYLDFINLFRQILYLTSDRK
jgi:uncharacterized protein